MPDVDGFELAMSLDNPPKIIFTTAYSEYAIEGYKVSTVDYLLKPIEYDDFLLAATKAKGLIIKHRLQNAYIEKSDDYLFIKSGEKHVRINFDDIK